MKKCNFVITLAIFVILLITSRVNTVYALNTCGTIMDDYCLVEGARIIPFGEFVNCSEDNGTKCCTSFESEVCTAKLDIFAGPTGENFNTLNPLKNFSDGSAGLTSPGAIVSRLLQFAFPLAGLILFAELVWGGFEMLIGATGKGIEAGKQRVTNALIGFILLFVAYWIFQIVEVIFGVVIL